MVNHAQPMSYISDIPVPVLLARKPAQVPVRLRDEDLRPQASWQRRTVVDRYLHGHAASDVLDRHGHLRIEHTKGVAELAEHFGYPVNYALLESELEATARKKLDERPERDRLSLVDRLRLRAP